MWWFGIGVITVLAYTYQAYPEFWEKVNAGHVFLVALFVCLGPITALCLGIGKLIENYYVK